jgi:hypothetical protein
VSSIRLSVVVIVVTLVARAAAMAAPTPVTAGGLTALPPVVLGPNVVQNPGFEAGAANWALASGWTVDETAATAHGGTKSLRLDGSEARLAAQPVVLHKGVYRLSAWIKTSAVTSPYVGGGVRMTLDLRPGGLNAWYSSHAVAGSSDWARSEVTAYIPTEGYQATVSLENYGAGAGVAWIDDVELVHHTAPPIDVYMLYPNYRGVIFDDHRPRAMKFDVTAAAGNGTRAVTVTVRDESTGAVVHAETFRAPGEHFVPEVDAGYMLPTDAQHPTRAYRVTFSVDTSPAYSYPDFRVSLLPASARKAMNVSFDADNNVLIRGEPRFILGLYDSNGDYVGSKEAWDEYLWSPAGDRRLADVPFNMYLNYIYGKMTEAPTEALMDSLRSRGARYLQTGNCGGGVPAEEFVVNSSDTYVRTVDTSGGPGEGIGGFYVADECTVDDVRSVFDQYVRLRSLAPDTMTLAVLLPNPDVPAWRDAGDVLATDPYPLWGAEPSGGYDHGLVASYAALTRETVMDARPFFTVLQFFRSTENSRWPTLAEMRSHAYMAIVEGSKGLFWWSVGNQSQGGGDLGRWCQWADQAGCDHGPSREALMAQLASVVQELAGTLPQGDADLPQALMAKDAPCALTASSNAAIKTRVKLFAGKGYVFAYNSLGASSGSQTATFTWNRTPGAVTVNAEVVNGQPRHITPSGLGFTDSFAPYEAHVYVIQNGGTSPAATSIDRFPGPPRCG